MTPDTARGPARRQFVVLLCNIGERDLRVNVGATHSPDWLSFDREDAPRLAAHLGVDLSGRPAGARTIGETLLRKLEVTAGSDALLERLQIPLIKPALDHVLRDTQSIDRLQLIATDQAEDASPHHRARDTVHVAELIRHVVRYLYSTDQVSDIPAALVASNSPHLEHTAYEFLKAHLPAMVPAGAKVIVFTSGGLPKLNQALHELALYLFRDRAHLYQLQEPPSQEEMRRGVLGRVVVVDRRPFVRDIVLRISEELLRYCEFVSVLGILSSLQEYQLATPGIEGALKYTLADLMTVLSPDQTRRSLGGARMLPFRTIGH